MLYAVAGVRSRAVADKTRLHLGRFATFYKEAYGHERLSACLRRDVVAWREQLVGVQKLSPATVNSHMASLSAMGTWLAAHAPQVFAMGDPTKGIGELALAPLEPRALSEMQVRSLKSLCDRLPRFFERRGRRPRAQRHAPAEPRRRGRPLRDRAIVFVLLSTGLRREELVQLDLAQLEPAGPAELRAARSARILGVRGKARTLRTVFLSTDARQALADYLLRERLYDASAHSPALFLSAAGIPARQACGRMSPRSINKILAQIGRWHDAEVVGKERKLSPLRPHDLRHTFAFGLARATGADAYELERRLGHRSQRYIQRYTNPPEEVTAQYVEDF